MLKRICMTLLAAAVIVVLSAPRPVIAAPGEVVYSENFTYRTGYAAGDPQWDNWKTFRADVKANIATTSSVTISGSRDPVGATCSDPVKAQQIASALGNGPYLFTLSCDGRTWNVGQCGYGIEINSNTLPVGDWQRTRVCRCLTSNAYIVRPTLWNRSNSNWGGINGPTCRGPSQSLKVTFVVGPQLIEVDLDIKPGGEPNSINTGSKGNIPVAILSDADFDAVARVDVATLAFGPGDAAPRKCSPEDVNADGLADLVCHFGTQDTSFSDSDTEGVLTGQDVDGTDLEGTDTVRLVPPKGKGKSGK